MLLAQSAARTDAQEGAVVGVSCGHRAPLDTRAVRIVWEVDDVDGLDVVSIS